MIVLSYGGGTNSTAVLVGLHERGIRPDIITFADTGAEKPHTYEHIEVVQQWLKKIDFPQIVTVRNEEPRVVEFGYGLENSCLARKQLPSIVYGYKSCSQKFKGEPQDKYLKSLPEVLSVWDRGEKITKIIGYDADEPHRANRVLPKEVTDKFDMWYPLVEWNWGRDECIEAIERAGLPRPGKSACFFCPSTTIPEIKELAIKYPDLAKRAIALEENAAGYNQTVKGLGRHWSWKEVISYQENQLDLFSCTIEQDCGCYDG